MNADQNLDIANLVPLKCTVKSTTVPEKTRHVKYAPEALTMLVETFNAVKTGGAPLDVKQCRPSYVHGCRSFIFEVPRCHADEIILAIMENITFDTLDDVGKYTLGQPVPFTQAEQQATRTETVWKGYIRVPVGFTYTPDSFSKQIGNAFEKCGLNVDSLAVLRDREYGLATPDYAVQFSSMDITGYVDITYLQTLRSFRVYGNSGWVLCSFEPFKEIAAKWRVCSSCLGVPNRTCICSAKGKTKVQIAGAASSSGTRAEAKANRLEAMKRKAREAAADRAKAMRTEMRTDQSAP